MKGRRSGKKSTAGQKRRHTHHMVRVVFDTNIFIQYFLNPGGIAGQCLRIIEDKKAQLFISNAILNEIITVVLRPNILSRFQDLTELSIDAFIHDIANISSHMAPVPKNFIFERDPKDEMIVDLAICSDAKYIVSRDHDLLDLMKGYTDECKDFRRRFRRLKVITPTEFLAIIEEKIPS
jgi:putative PIN family toxin of toxin-antitoxin system